MSGQDPVKQNAEVATTPAGSVAAGPKKVVLRQVRRQRHQAMLQMPRHVQLSWTEGHGPACCEYARGTTALDDQATKQTQHWSQHTGPVCEVGQPGHEVPAKRKMWDPVTVDQLGPVLAKEHNVTFGFSAVFQAARITVHGGNHFPKLLALSDNPA